jgi:hypothetical protein
VQGIAVVTATKFGLGIAAGLAEGLVLAKLPSGEW